VTTRDGFVAEYALRDINKPIGIGRQPAVDRGALMSRARSSLIPRWFVVSYQPEAEGSR
jgi:hypothetical protein